MRVVLWIYWFRKNFLVPYKVYTLEYKYFFDLSQIMSCILRKSYIFQINFQSIVNYFRTYQLSSIIEDN